MRASLRLPAALLAATVVVAAGGCPGTPTPDAGGDGDGDGDGDVDAGVDAGLDLTRDPSCDKGKWVVVLQARVALPGGEPASGALFQTCARVISGALICLEPRPVGADGTIEVVVPEAARCVDKMTARVYIPNSDTTTAYCHLHLEDDQPIVDITSGLVLHPTTPAVSLDPLVTGDEDDPHTVVFPGDLEVELIPNEYFADRGPLSADPSYNHLSAAVFEQPGPADLCFLEESPAMYRVYGFSPEGDLAVRASVKMGPTPFAAGAEVPLYALGGLSCTGGAGTENGIAEGDWEVFGTGVVDEEGYVTASGDDGLPCVIWMGVGYPPDATGSDGGVTDGGVTDGGVTDGGVADGG